MLKVGLTGNIGSGKIGGGAGVRNTGSSRFYDVDEKAAHIMEKEEVLKHVMEAWGRGVFDKNGKINRKKLADKFLPRKWNLTGLTA